jgi:lysophospholipase L1-like esterase
MNEWAARQSGPTEKIHSMSTGHARVGLASVVGIPLLVMVDSLIAFARGWHSGSRPEQVLMGLCGSVLAGGLLLYAIPAGRRFYARRSFALHLMVLALVLGLGVVEVSLQFLSRPQWSLRLHTRTPNLKGRFDPLPELMPGVSGESRVTTNDRGIRGGPIPEDRSVYRILCVGGSATECLYLDDSETWPHVLMEQLNGSGMFGPTWVGNVGISGFSSLNHLRFLKESDLPGQVDCMVFLVGANDFLKFISGRLFEEQLPPLWVKSGTWDLVLRSWIEIRRRQGRQETDAEDAQGRIYVERRRQRREARHAESLPDLSAAIRDYQARIREMIRLCQDKKIRPIFVTQPMLWRAGLSEKAVGLLWLGILKDGSFAEIVPLERGIAAYNAALQEVCKQESVECVDAGGLNGREEFYYDDAHYNEAGARFMADLIARHFLATKKN